VNTAMNLGGGVNKRRRVSCIAEWLLDFQGGVCCELINVETRYFPVLVKSKYPLPWRGIHQQKKTTYIINISSGLNLISEKAEDRNINKYTSLVMVARGELLSTELQSILHA